MTIITTAAPLAHGFAMRGQRILLVDLDPQGHVAFALGAEKSPGLYRLIVDEEPLEKVVIPAARFIHCPQRGSIKPDSKPLRANFRPFLDKRSHP